MLKIIINILLINLAIVSGILSAQGNSLLKIKIMEDYGLDRELEYVELSCQLADYIFESNEISFFVEEVKNGKKIDCQVIKTDTINNQVLATVIFPISCKAYEQKDYMLKTKIAEEIIPTDLSMIGQGTELVIENKFYRADLRKSDNAEPQSHMSGQIRELLIKMKFDQLVTNVEDRLHWAPNFKRPELEYYTTIAHWNNPRINKITSGQYQISTLREDLAPSHPEILLTARYRFYAGLPYFRFYSSMEVKDNLCLELLRNDEMAMDSMFTHMAFQRPSGEIVDVEFSKRYELLKNQPIQNNSPWLCFYNLDKGFALGTIRINYDNTNNYGRPSPTFVAHTQIGEWLKGVKYWNRRLIHDQLTFIPEGSCYKEDNAYLVFRIDKNNRLKDIRYWAERIRSPIQVSVEYL